ncbi:MAG: type II toxin-antitoxin system HicB family antitoxin [Desulfobacterales bacterium]|nr:MAG: type II toxin-antitoxin system HicB family antitoxin [Desulfobacterales bacterium]
MKFIIIIEQAEGNFSAYSPDLPGCVATGASVEETEKNMIEAVKFHLEGMAAENIPVPPTTTVVRQVEIAA